MSRYRQCACGNTARHGETLCGACITLQQRAVSRANWVAEREYHLAVLQHDAHDPIKVKDALIFVLQYLGRHS
jgi:hypothetical protein